MRLIISPHYQHRTVIHAPLKWRTHAFESIDPRNYNIKYGCRLHGINERSFCLGGLRDAVQLRLAEIKFTPLLGKSPFPQHYSTVRLPAWWSDRLNSIATMA